VSLINKVLISTVKHRPTTAHAHAQLRVVSWQWQRHPIPRTHSNYRRRCRRYYSRPTVCSSLLEYDVGLYNSELGVCFPEE